MRKLAVTAFAILYGLMAVSLSAQRSLAHRTPGHNSNRLGKAERTDTLLFEKKLLEKQLVAEAPGDVVARPEWSGRHANLVSYQYEPLAYSRPSPSRAPPSLI